MLGSQHKRYGKAFCLLMNVFDPARAVQVWLQMDRALRLHAQRQLPTP